MLKNDSLQKAKKFVVNKIIHFLEIMKGDEKKRKRLE
jgi:hypothetical protein